MKRRSLLTATGMLGVTGAACSFDCRAAGASDAGGVSNFLAEGCTLTRAASGLYFPPAFKGATIGSSWDVALTSSALLFLNWLGFEDSELTSVATFVGSYVAYAHRDVDVDVRVRVGWSWLQHCLEQDEAAMDAASLGKPAIAAILAHEVAHLFQYKTGLYATLTPGGRVLNAELHADYMSGFMLASVGRVRAVDMAKAAGMMSVGGDNNPLPAQHHGTPVQRRKALQAGWVDARHGRAGPLEASRSGMAAVERIATVDAP